MPTPMRPSRRVAAAPLAAAIALGGIATTWWIVGRPDPEVAAQELGSEPGHTANAVDCNAASYSNRITGTVAGDVQVIAHGTLCRIRGTVQGNVTVRDERAQCNENDAITAVDVVGGTVEGDIVALGGACVMVFLEDGARVAGDVVYQASGNLGFLGNADGAWVGGSVLLQGGRLWAHGDSTTNRIDGDLVCDGGQPKGGLGSGSEANWDGFQNDIDGSLGGTYQSC
jgi:hypothetical protein